MLKSLYKKLNLIFTGSIMLIISFIIGILSVNYIHTEQVNDSIFFQRMATMLIYQLEDNQQDIKEVLRPYEEKHSIFCSIQDTAGNLLYQSELTFPTKTELLLKAFYQQTTYTMEFITEQISSTQGGIFEFTGTSNEKYWGIPATVVSHNDTIYYLTFIYQQKPSFPALQKQLPVYFFLWLFSLLCVVFLGHLLLKKALKPTEQALKSQKEFIASASHELKSPLAVILANVERLGQQADTPDFKKTIKTIDSECMRMSGLIKDMLLLASSDAKTWTLCKSAVNVDTLLITLYEAYEPICVRKNITLHLALSENSYPELYTDQERLLQILNIYMDNAVHHAAKNRLIEIQTEVTAKNITFLIADHGTGIGKEDRPYIFNRFYCADKSHTNKSHFGLGLSIADELAKMLQGKAGFKDTDGGGSTFFVTLPRA